jgi:hypothetical protein
LEPGTELEITPELIVEFHDRGTLCPRKPETDSVYAVYDSGNTAFFVNSDGTISAFKNMDAERIVIDYCW